jgi:hypothetical protein
MLAIAGFCHGSLPFRYEPVVKGYCPLKNDARDGTHEGAAQYA